MSCEQACPHWSPGSMSCLLSRGGLYLPVSDHIAAYCRTENYLACPQFVSGGLVVESAASGSVDTGAERRMYARIPGRFLLRLGLRSDSDFMNEVIDDTACTVDISLGGLRVESYRELPVDSLVTFSLNGDFSGEPVKGVGRVAWCRSLEQAPLYHAGLAFEDVRLASMLEKRLGVSSS
ncbi:PilZ domain-containing protein [Desulfolithobacter sp.]